MAIALVVAVSTRVAQVGETESKGSNDDPQSRLSFRVIKFAKTAFALPSKSMQSMPTIPMSSLPLDGWIRVE